MSDTDARLDRYVLEEVLGEGGMGRVYRALDPRLGRRVALKVLLAGSHPEAAARMMREARAAAAFNHPNVVAIYDVGEHEESPFIAMELVTGQTLRAFVSQDIPIAQKVAWLLDAARGLGAAHRAGLVHRDIKPDNVMITTDGVVKILDFGIARLAQSGPDGLAPTVTPNLPSLTAAGVAIGTLQYMPPEQLKGEPLDGRADQFAWGVTAYELLCGVHPWAAATGPQLVAAVLATDARAPRDVRPDIDGRVSDAIARALQKRAEDRFGTMEELIASIEGTQNSPRAVISASRMSPGASTALGTANTTQAPAELKVSAASAAKRSWAKAATFTVVGLATLSGALLTYRAKLSPVKPVAAAGASPSVDASPPGPRIGRPPATPAAAASYAAALQEERDAKLSSEMHSLETTIEEDPSFAAAFVRRAGLYLLVAAPDEARDDFHKAWDLRAGLGEIDAAILDAIEPAVRAPPVAAEFLARIVKVADRYPAELFPSILGAAAYTDAEQAGPAAALYDRAIVADPSAALPYFGKGELAMHNGDLDAGVQLFGQCTRMSPTNVECLSGKWIALADTGRCEEGKAVARQALANDREPDWDESLAAAAAATGEPIELVSEYLRAADETTKEKLRASETAKHATEVALLRGDFRAAEAFAKNWDLALKDEHKKTLVAAVARFRIVEEEGELKARRAELGETWTRALAWLDPSDTARLRLSYAEYEAGLLTKDELRARREAWKSAQIEAAHRSGAPAADEALWREMYVADAKTPEEAREAIAHYAEVGTPKLGIEGGAPRDQLMFGTAYARAGEYAKAVPLLQEGTRMCRDLGDRFAQTQALFDLGVALEHTGDAGGAKEAYAGIVRAWGKAKPRSVTVEKARKRLAELGK
jgi:serine/threonine protein kinase/tetratricopeptide (TPR) repeat protein